MVTKIKLVHLTFSLVVQEPQTGIISQYVNVA